MFITRPKEIKKNPDNVRKGSELIEICPLFNEIVINSL